jgi:NADH:ubiquinone oxidoreductase subunit E
MEILSEKNFEKLDFIIKSHESTNGKLMPILQEAQDVFGSIPKEVMVYISEKTNIPLADIYGVVTFYTQFRMEPKGKHTISVCLGTACYVKGSNKIIEKASELLGIKINETTNDRQFTLEATRCIGACGLAPIMTVDSDVYAKVSEDQLDEIIKKYKVNL